MKFAIHRGLIFTEAALCTLLLFFCGLAFAQAPFYQGKTITLIISTNPGGTGDLRIKATMPYLSKYIPGNPNIVAQYVSALAVGPRRIRFISLVKPDGLTIGKPRRVDGNQRGYERRRRRIRRRQIHLLRLSRQDRPLGVRHPQRSRLEHDRETPRRFRTTDRGAIGRPYDLYHRPAVRLGVRHQRAEIRRRLFRS